jgi:hypothetical protein
MGTNVCVFLHTVLLSFSVANCACLFRANKIVFAELHWDINLLLQAESSLLVQAGSNAEHSDAKSCVLVDYLLADFTLDGLVWQWISKQIQSNFTHTGQLEFLKEILAEIDSFNATRLDSYQPDDPSDQLLEKAVCSGTITIHMDDGDDLTPPKLRQVKKINQSLVGTKRPMFPHADFTVNNKIRKNFE